MIKSNAIANTLIMFTPIILILLLSVAMSPVVSLVIVVTAYILGITMLFRSKLSLFRQGILISFGPTKLDGKNRQRYVIGYAIIGCAMLLNVVSIALFSNLFPI